MTPTPVPTVSPDAIFGLSATEVTALATIALAIVGALAFGASAFLAWTTRRMARATTEAAEATQRAAAATETAAKATQDAAVATREEAEATQEEAKATLEQATATKDQVKVASETLGELRQSRELEWRPILVSTEILGGIAQGKAYRDVVLRNIGRGPALNSLFLREEAADEGTRFLLGGPVSLGAGEHDDLHAVEQEKPPHPKLFHRNEMPRELLICQDQFGNTFRFVPGFPEPTIWSRADDEQGFEAEPGWIKGQKEILAAQRRPEPEPEPGPEFIRVVRGQGMSYNCEASIVIESVPPSDLKPSDGTRDIVEEWMLSLRPDAHAVSLGIGRWEAGPPDKPYDVVWRGSLGPGPTIGVTEVLKLQKNQPPPTRGGLEARVPLRTLVEYWRKLVAGASATMTNLGIKRIRLGLTMTTYGTFDQTSLVDVDFSDLPSISRAVVDAPHGQLVSFTSPAFDVNQFPSQFFESAVRDLLRLFGYREVDKIIPTLDLGTWA